MTEENKGAVEPNQSTESQVEEKSNTVTREAYERALGEKKQFKQKFDAMQTQLNELLAEKKSAEESVLAEQGRYKELHEKSQAELAELQKTIAQEREAALSARKYMAFKENVGEFANPAYAQMLDLSAIKTTESGEIDVDSLKEYGASFRETHGQLFKGQTKPSPTSHAPKGHGNEKVDKLTALKGLL